MSEKTSPDRDGLFELAAVAFGGAARVGLALASMPLVTLPVSERQRVRQAMGEMAMAIVSVPRELADLTVRVVDRVYEDDDKGMPRVPSAEEVVSGARSFTQRLSRAAEEFSATVKLN